MSPAQAQAYLQAQAQLLGDSGSSWERDLRRICAASTTFLWCYTRAKDRPLPFLIRARPDLQAQVSSVSTNAMKITPTTAPAALSSIATEGKEETEAAAEERLGAGLISIPVTSSVSVEDHSCARSNSGDGDTAGDEGKCEDKQQNITGAQGLSSSSALLSSSSTLAAECGSMSGRSAAPLPAANNTSTESHDLPEASALFELLKYMKPLGPQEDCKQADDSTGRASLKKTNGVGLVSEWTVFAAFVTQSGEQVGRLLTLLFGPPEPHSGDDSRSYSSSENRHSGAAQSDLASDLTRALGRINGDTVHRIGALAAGEASMILQVATDRLLGVASYNDKSLVSMFCSLL